MPSDTFRDIQATARQEALAKAIADLEARMEKEQQFLDELRALQQASPASIRSVHVAGYLNKQA